MQFFIINYSHHAVHYISTTYLLYNWKFDPRYPFCSHSPLPPSPLTTTSLFSVSIRVFFFNFYFKIPYISGVILCLSLPDLLHLQTAFFFTVPPIKATIWLSKYLGSENAEVRVNKWVQFPHCKGNLFFSFFPFFFFFFFFFCFFWSFWSHTCSIWTFLGQGSNQSCSC